MSIAWRAIAAVILLIGAWLFWGGYHAVDFVVSRGSSLSDALLQPPTSLIRLLAAGLMALGAALVIFRIPAGRWVVLAGFVLFTLLAVLMAASGAEAVLWLDEAITTAVLWLLFAGLVITKRS